MKKRARHVPPKAPRQIVLRPVGRGAWRALILNVVQYPRVQGRLFHLDDGELELARKGDQWVINGRAYRVAELRT